MEDLFSFGAWVRRRRRALGLAEEDLAWQLGCALSVVRQIEADALVITQPLAERLAECLEIHVYDWDAFIQAACDPSLSSPPSTATGGQLRPPTSFPLQLTSFIGRRRELDSLITLCATQRLVTLTGEGGTGKTRLALQAAGSMLSSFADGGCLIELAPVQHPGLVAQTVASVLGLRAQQPDLLSALAAALCDQHMLLLLDNCEHLLDACAELAATLLAQCPRLHILATSREPLNLLGEQRYPLNPLPVPTPDLSSMDALSDIESVQLFAERARAVSPDFALTSANAAAVAEICRRLDGLPLVIELAAAQIRQFPVAVLAERLRTPLAVLVRGPRNLPPRQQTLRATIAWSFQSLDPPQQQLFTQLGVFVGGWTVDLAAAVCHTTGPTPIDDLLLALFDKSLIRRAEPPHDPPRFTMLETIRAFAAEQLAQHGALDQLRQRHAHAYASLLEQATPALEHGSEQPWLERLDREHDNLRAALQWATEPGPADQQRGLVALRICGVLWRFWRLRSLLQEGRRWIDQVLALPDVPSAHARLHAQTLKGAGILALMQGDLAAATPLFEASLALWHTLDDTTAIARTLISLGTVCYHQQDLAGATVYFEQSLALQRTLDDTRGMVSVLNNLGNIAFRKGDLQHAQELYEESFRLLEDAGDRQTIAVITSNLGEIARLQQRYEQAALLHYTSATIYLETNFVDGLISCLNHLVELTIDLQRPELAAQLIGLADSLYRQVNAVRSPDQARDYERQLADISRQLTPTHFTQLRRTGQATPIATLLEQVVEHIRLGFRIMSE